MAKKKAAKSKSKKTGKRSLDAHGGQPALGAPPNEQDPKRRLGNFTGAGEHARQGGRTSGIVGQTIQKNKTDKRGQK